MEKKIWVLLIVGLCCISSSKAQDGDSMAFDDFDPLEEEYAIDKREEYFPDEDGTSLAEREYEDELQLEDAHFGEPALEDMHFREFEDEGPEVYDEEMEEELEERAEGEKEEEEEECEALAKGKKDTCETDVESETEEEGEKSKDRLILNRKTQTFTDLAKAGRHKQIFHIDYKRDVLAVALQHRKLCILYKLPEVMKKSSGTFRTMAGKVAAFSKKLGKKKASLWKKATYVWTRYKATFQLTDVGVNKSSLGTTITDKICKGLDMKWVKVVKPTKGQTETKDKKTERRGTEAKNPSQKDPSQQILNSCAQEKDAGPCRKAEKRFYYDQEAGTCREFIYGGCQGNGNNYASMDQCQEECETDEELVEERNLAKRKTTVCHVVFLKTERKVVKEYKCGWWWQDTCKTYKPVNIYTMRCN